MRAIAQHAWREARTKQRTYYMSARSPEATMTDGKAVRLFLCLGDCVGT